MPSETGNLTQNLAAKGLKSTRRREEIYRVVFESKDHPTAEAIFSRVKGRIPGISFATVYNCLGALVQSGLVRQVVLDRSSARYCPNMREHAHFFCQKCGEVTDMDSVVKAIESNVPVPKGFKINHVDLALHGSCPKCE